MCDLDLWEARILGVQNGKARRPHRRQEHSTQQKKLSTKKFIERACWLGQAAAAAPAAAAANVFSLNEMIGKCNFSP